MESAGPARVTSAREMGLLACPRCQTVWPREAHRCGRCDRPLASRDPHSLQKVWAWWLVGLAAYIPANLLPMLRTRTLVSAQEDTIVGGAIELARYGNWGVAIIIIVASVCIPLGKFFVIAALALGVRRGSRLSARRRAQLYEVVEYIGRWSMIDVFVVAILSSLVQLSVLASIAPGPASLYFALSVIFTMLSAQSFDSRLIWDARDAAPDQARPAPGVART